MPHYLKKKIPGKETGHIELNVNIKLNVKNANMELIIVDRIHTP